jgi:hypothetical protein
VLALAAVPVLAGCGGDTERTLPEATPPAVSSLTPQQIVTEAQRSLSSATSVHITGQYRENNAPVGLDMRIAAGDRAVGTVTTNGSRVELRRIGDRLYVRGDDKFLAALGPAALSTAKGKWLVAPVAQADRGLANLTDLTRFAGTLDPGKGSLVKEPVRSLAGQQTVPVRSSTGARLYVAEAATPFPLRVERTGDVNGFVDYGDYNAPVDVPVPSPVADLATING